MTPKGDSNEQDKCVSNAISENKEISTILETLEKITHCQFCFKKDFNKIVNHFISKFRQVY